MLADESMAVLTKIKFLKAINLRILPSTTFNNPSNSEIFIDLYKIGY